MYDTPATYFVNQFVGTANVLAGTLDAVSGDGASVRLEDGTLLPARAPAGIAAGARVVACIRPENMCLGEQAPSAIEGTVELGMPLGATIVHEIRTRNGLRLKLSEPRAPGTVARETGARVWIRPATPSSVMVFAAP